MSLASMWLRVMRAVKFWWRRAPRQKRLAVQALQTMQDYRIAAEDAQHREDQARMVRESEADEYAAMMAACERALSGSGDTRVALVPAAVEIVAPALELAEEDWDAVEAIEPAEAAHAARMQRPA